MNNMNLAPRFCANSTIGPLKLTDYMGKWLVILSYDNDFTPVCTTEVIALSKLYNNFLDNNCDILMFSKDTLPTHIAWINDISKNTNVSVPFAIVSDENGEISNLYNTSGANSVYIIDPDQVIRSNITYPKNIGRNMSEILRTVCAMQETDVSNSLTPANWLPGNDVLVDSPNGYVELMDRLRSSTRGDFSWVMNDNRGFNI